VSSWACGSHPFSQRETTSVRQRGRIAMSDTAIFIIGLVVSVLLAGGLRFTVLEFRRLDKEATSKRQANARAASST